MKFSPSHLSIALALVLCSTPFHQAYSQEPNAEAAPVAGNDLTEQEARTDFWARMGKVRDACDWNLLLQSGREWQKSHPGDGNGWFAEGVGAYFLSDMKTAIAAFERSKQIDPSATANANQWASKARLIQWKFPKLELQPLIFEWGEGIKESQSWVEKGRTLRVNRRYGEIEKIAVQLQKSNSANINGQPHLEAFFVGAASGTGGPGTPQKEIEAWVKAKPTSTLARVAQIQFWTNAAWKARGNGLASTITPTMEKRMAECLGRGAQLIGTLPKTATQSPLTYMCLMGWGQLAQGREFQDETYQAAVKKFPSYFPFYIRRANLLLPRWYGEDGEIEALLSARANQIGGENGDIFYGRAVSTLLFNQRDSFEEMGVSYERVEKGLKALQKRKPTAIEPSNSLLRVATSAKNWKAAQEILLSPLGNHVDPRWRMENASMGPYTWSSWRMDILAQ